MHRSNPFNLLGGPAGAGDRGCNFYVMRFATLAKGDNERVCTYMAVGREDVLLGRFFFYFSTVVEVSLAVFRRFDCDGSWEFDCIRFSKVCRVVIALDS